MNTTDDKRIVMTLDAGGTNFVFSAMQGNEAITDAVKLPSNANDLDKCMQTIIDGFKTVREKLSEEPVAVSFAFPGPADYKNGIIGDLPNLPAFRGGVALGPMLTEQLGLPVFINNDGWLYAYGEALTGFLPQINQELQAAGSEKQFSNLVGITLGTGFGLGIVRKGKLFVGDNVGAEAWIMGTKYNPRCNAEEEGVAIRVVKRKYAEYAGIKDSKLEPKDIFEIAMGEKEGNEQAAKDAYAYFGKVLGDALANITALIDGLIVIGGGVAGAKSLIVPSMLEEMRSEWVTYDNQRFPRLTPYVYNLDDEKEMDQFLEGDEKELKVYGSERKVVYDRDDRIGVAFTREDTSTMIARGAYAYALNQLDQ